MEKYNLNVLSFLIGTFKDIIKTFGQNSKAVDYYKRQTYSMIQIGQLRIKEVKFVERLVGMENTSAVKWDMAVTKIMMFTQEMSTVLSYDNEVTVNFILQQDLNSNKITESVKQLVLEALGMNDLSKSISRQSVEKKNNFGELPVKDTSNISLDSANGTISTAKSSSNKLSGIRTWKMLLNCVSTLRHPAELRIKNLNAICSRDPSYFELAINDDFDVSCHLDLLSQGADWEIGYTEIDKSNPCSYKYKFIAVIGANNIDIDWREIQIDKDKHLAALRARRYKESSRC